ncbi:MAG: radical SAM protein [Candidatus Lokiarchaeota archaeon]|nr:radical SAM protein [Candidatus Lokiarchaeota archaeon]
MNLKQYPYIPMNIVLRKYKDYNIYDLKNDESYIIDEEAYSVLRLVDGETSIKELLENYSLDKKSEVKEAIIQFNEIGVIEFNPSKISDTSIKKTDHINIPKRNPLNPPYLKNLMINITEKCNLTCKHCYITEKNRIDMSLEDLMSIIKDFYELQGIRLILTGGEPFLYSEFKTLLQQLISIPLQKVILSNGTLINKQDQTVLNLLKENFCEIFVSIDGLEESHNDFRNANCFQDTIEGIKTLMNNKITVSINTMIHKQNLIEFDNLFKLISSLGDIKNWSIDIPTFDENTPKEIKERYEISYEQGGQILKDYGWGVIYESHSEGEKVNYACGPYMMAIDVVGNITKCGFFTEQRIGNVFKLGLNKGWESVQENLNWNIDDLKCNELNCEFLEDCRGGCRYRAYRQTSDIMGIDSFKCFQFGKNNYKK